MSNTSPSRLKNKEKIVVICSVCGAEYNISYATYHRKGGESYQWKCKRCIMETMSDEAKKLRSDKIKYSLNNKSDIEKMRMTNKRLATINTDEFKADVKKKKQDAWASKSSKELEAISKKASLNTKHIWDDRAKGICKNQKYEETKGEKISKALKKYWAEMPEEEYQKIKLLKKNEWASKSEEEKEKIRDLMKNRWASMDDNERLKISKNMSKSAKLKFENMSNKNKEKFIRNLSKVNKAKWNNLSNEEKNQKIFELRNNYNDYLNNKTEEDRKLFSNKIKNAWNSLNDDEKSKRINHLLENRKIWWDSLSNEEKDNYKKIQIEKVTNSWNSLSDIDKINKISKMVEGNHNYWDALTDQEKIDKINKSIKKSYNQNEFHKRFEKAFNESHLINLFYYTSEYYTLNNGIHHKWDYGIFNSNNDLVAVVDLDGAYYHADDCDYDGMHSKEEYDECRAQSVPDGIHHFIIQEFRFKDGFERILKTIMLDYDQYVENTFRELRSQPFPYPHYTDVELMKSFDKLQRMDCNDKYHQDISLNTRVGDRLIQHFHQSIWHDHVDGELSPYEAWQDDDLLHEVIRNRIIYQTHLNLNKILQGFNIAKKAPKVSVFSAGRAKMIINRYLSEFDIIFDPFSGYSGRMLGAIASKKQYIGQDLSERHVRESNNMMEFLRKYGITFNASISQRNILESNGKYQCLFTCPPYGKKEQWEDVPVDLRTCDDWIDECLQRFRCKRYVFVVDTTEKYKDNIAAEISNKSHFSNAKEYIIIIDK